jgi:undecaprenyl-diphosphatase
MTDEQPQAGTTAPADEKQQVGETLRDAVRDVRSPEQAERVLDDIERLAADLTEAEAAGGVEASATPPAELVQRAAEAHPTPTQRAAAALTTAAAEAVRPDERGRPTLEAAQELLQPEAHARRPVGEVVKPRAYLQEAVVRRLNPLEAWDATVFIAVNHLPHSRLSNALFYGLTVVSTGGLCWLVGAGLAHLAGIRRGGRALRELLIAVTFATWLVEYPIKAYFRRRRPFIDVVRALVIGKKPGSWSFPSGHTASSFAAAGVLTTIWPRRATLFYTVAGLVGFSRVYLGAHYPGDVLSGALCGATLGELGRRLARTLGR